MTIEKFITTLRMVLGDSRKIKYSDEHLIEAINLVLSMASDVLADCNYYVVKDTMSLTSGDNYLPSNFSKLIDFGDTKNVTFEILGTKLTVNKDCTMTYYFTLSEITEIDDNFPLPDTFKEPIINYVTMFLAGKSIQDLKQVMMVDLTKKAVGNYILEFSMPFKI